MAKILTVSRKKTKILTVNRGSHHPIETLVYAETTMAKLISFFFLPFHCLKDKIY